MIAATAATSATAPASATSAPAPAATSSRTLLQKVAQKYWDRGYLAFPLKLWGEGWKEQPDGELKFKKGDDFHRSADQTEPESVRARSQSGGLHMYFKYVQDLPTCVGVFNGVDIRNDNGCIYAPPSSFVFEGKKREYTWHPGFSLIDNEDELKEMPKWLLEAIRKRLADNNKTKKRPTNILPSSKRIMVGISDDSDSGGDDEDDGMLKEYNGGSRKLVKYRPAGEKDEREYPWQGNIDTTDEAFIGRLMIIPHCSKFVAELPDPDGLEHKDREHVHLRKPDVIMKIQGPWRPYVLQWCLKGLQRFYAEEFTKRPASSNQWLSDITMSQDDVKELVKAHLVYTGNPQKYIKQGFVWELYRDHCGVNSIPTGKRMKQAPFFKHLRRIMSK
ncbi:hypothetical protein HK102_009569, partial [Quaeritorhiza haematococci]